jgi:hypothetical protein
MTFAATFRAFAYAGTVSATFIARNIIAPVRATVSGLIVSICTIALFRHLICSFSKE